MKFDMTRLEKILLEPLAVVKDSFWNEHIPFAFLLIDALRPRLLVELGVYRGGSFNVWCDAVKASGAGTLCHGIDNWKGDPHNRFYDDRVFEELSAVHARHYRGVSRLWRMSFDEARGEFADGSIDLLHIDGYHAYDAVKADFESWLPAVSDRGVVLFHDTAYRERDYGVWRLWEEISPLYPSYEFKFGCGLGILAVGRRVDPEFLSLLEEFNSRPFYHDLFRRLGGIFTLRGRLDDEKSLVTILRSQIEEVGRELIAVHERLIDVNAQRERAVCDLEIRNHELATKENELTISRKQLHDTEKQLHAICSSLVWRFSRKMLRIARVLRLPSGVHRTTPKPSDGN